MSPYETCQYGLLFVRIFSFRFLRRTPPKDSIQSVQSGVFFKFFRLLVILGILLAFFIGKFLEHLYGIGRWDLPIITLLVGIGLFVLGLSLQLYAAHCLGKFFTSRVVVLKKQEVITDGPYKYIRHPGSLGTMLSYYGIGIATDNWVITTLIVVFTTGLFVAHIVGEDRFLCSQLCRYEDYQKTTARLFPGIY